MDTGLSDPVVSNMLPAPPEFTETVVPGYYLAEATLESTGTIETLYSIEGLEQTIAKFIDEFNPGFHRANITADLPHVMVLSTGRCGTVSLYRLLQGSNVIPYHAYWLNISLSERWEMMCRLIAGEYQGGVLVYQNWLATRAAEWLDAISQNRPMVALNHTDTIFAPIFAALHPRAKFIWLRRNKEATRKSFIDKHQSLGELGNQLRPLFYDMNPFRWRRTEHSKAECIDWHLQFTEDFCTAFGRVCNMITIDAESLFHQDSGAIKNMLDFMGADIEIEKAIKHYETPINVKEAKIK